MARFFSSQRPRRDTFTFDATGSTDVDGSVPQS
jgi:hypothetical protein